MHVLKILPRGVRLYFSSVLWSLDYSWRFECKSRRCVELRTLWHLCPIIRHKLEWPSAVMTSISSNYCVVYDRMRRFIAAIFWLCTRYCLDHLRFMALYRQHSGYSEERVGDGVRTCCYIFRASCSWTDLRRQSSTITSFGIITSCRGTSVRAATLYLTPAFNHPNHTSPPVSPTPNISGAQNTFPNTVNYFFASSALNAVFVYVLELITLLCCSELQTATRYI